MKIMLKVFSLNMARSIVFIFFCIGAQFSASESLYNEETYRGHATDIKAKQLGDSLTVLIVENAKAEASNDTDSNESTDNSLSESNNANNESFGLDTDSQYKGGGEVARSGELIAKITVTVTEVLPTGELRVKGEQNIQINKEKQAISLSGNVRPTDINADNTVLSTRIANAEIIYNGEGHISDVEPGVITQFFRWLF